MLAKLSVVIPTYRREDVLIETLCHLRALDPPPYETVIIDQTPLHLPQTEAALSDLQRKGAIRHIYVNRPSIPIAMNRGLLAARGDIVLFLDDDIVPEPGLVAAHLAAHAARPRQLVAGRVIQPWEEGVEFSCDTAFHFASTRAAEIDQFMGGNFSLRRDEALSLGGFDQNFVKVAYRFEAEFAFRWRKAGGSICFEPQACIHHLKSGDGGTRSFGDHLTTWLPGHSVGAYYFLLRTGGGASTLLTRPARAVATRYHLRRPWRIPATLTSEVLGALWALRLAARGPALIESSDRHSDV